MSPPPTRDAIVVVEAAILIETGSHAPFRQDHAGRLPPKQQQVERAVKRDGVTPEEARERLARQMPLEEKRKYADFIIDSSGAKESTIEQTRAVYQKLRSFEK